MHYTVGLNRTRSCNYSRFIHSRVSQYKLFLKSMCRGDTFLITDCVDVNHYSILLWSKAIIDVDKKN